MYKFFNLDYFFLVLFMFFMRKYLFEFIYSEVKSGKIIV